MTHTNTTKNDAGATNANVLHTDHNSADSRSHGPIQQALDGNKTTWLTVAYRRIKDAVGGFYLDRGIGIEAIFAVIMLTTFALVRFLK